MDLIGPSNGPNNRSEDVWTICFTNRNRTE